MVEKIQGINESTKLLLDSGENEFVDYKTDVSGVKPADLVAFANSPNGGNILVGVDEAYRPDGSMYGKITGDDISDKTILKITDRAQTCNPPVTVRITIENCSDLPIINVRIDSGQFKPYCTQSGTYKIRGESQLEALLPDKLLNLFIEREETKFLTRFSNVTKKLEDDIRRTLKTVFDLENAIEGKLNEVMWDLNSTEEEATQTSSKIDEVIALCLKIDSEIKSREVFLVEQSRRNRKIISLLKAEDPSEDYLREIIEKKIATSIEETPIFQTQLFEEGIERVVIPNAWLKILDEKTIKDLVKCTIRDMSG